MFCRVGSSLLLALTFIVLVTHLPSVTPVTSGTSVTSDTACDPVTNCKPPNCRCWDDPKIPGGLSPKQTPQMILISFGSAIDKANADMYASLLEGIRNPNGCLAKSTFFVRDNDTDFDVVAALFRDKHEIGITTADGTVPNTTQGWIDSLKRTKTALQDAGLYANEILGTRIPQLSPGGNDQFMSMNYSQLTYDTSCVSLKHSGVDTLLWPYTYDFVDRTPVCNSGKAPSKPFKGMWQFPVATLFFNDYPCATPSDCRVETSDDVFKMFYTSFIHHYTSKNRAPFLIYINPQWLMADFRKNGTRLFFSFLHANFNKDVWFVTYQQALVWIKKPTALSEINSFNRWKC